MSVFGDAEPEDAWDPDDPVDELIANLFRRFALFGITRGDDGGDVDERLDEIGVLIAAVQLQDHLTVRDRLRVRHLVEDLAHIRNRVEED